MNDAPAVVWLLAIVFLPVIGPLAWFVFGRRGTEVGGARARRPAGDPPHTRPSDR